MTELCDLTPMETTGCCGTTPQPEPELTNPPGLDTLRYRLGTFATVRRRLLEALGARLTNWTDFGTSDYGIVLLESWATLADILTFYQERIANEAFLRTAVLRSSIVRIGELVDYRPNPGAAATTYLAFTADTGKVVALPSGFRSQTKPAPGAAPVTFETDEALTAYANLNTLAVRTHQAQPLGAGDRHAIVGGTKTGLKPGDRILVVGGERLTDAGSERWEVRRVSGVHPDSAASVTRIEWSEPLGHRIPRVDPPAVPSLYAFRLQAWPFGYNAPSYAALTVSTTVTTTGADGHPVTVVLTSAPSLPDWTGKHLPELQPAGEGRVTAGRDLIFLDSVYPPIVAGSWIVLATAESVVVPEGPSATNVAHPAGYAELYRVRAADETVHSGYTLTSKVTRLKVDTVTQLRKPVDSHGGPAAGPVVPVTQPENIDVFPIQGTNVLAQSDELTLVDIPRADDIEGSSIELAQAYSDLNIGRLLVVTGRARGSAAPLAEPVRVKTITASGAGAIVGLESPLRYSYDPATVTIYGNVAAASHGETVADEILGSGDAAQLFQEFTLKKSPLTFVRASGAEANRWGTRPALEVRANGIRWNERETLLDSGPNDRDYVTLVDADDRGTVRFGGGSPVGEATDDPEEGGATPPTGRDNIRATYRHGLGLIGNISRGAVATLVSSAPGMKAVSNPLPGTGGADRERDDEVKVNLPASMRAFDRAVSLADYAALARTYSGVAKAQAFLERRGREVPRVRLTVAATDRLPPLQPSFKEALRGFLDARRDPNQPLILSDFSVIAVDLAITIEADADRRPDDVRSDVAAAFSAVRNADGGFGLFAFERLDFGQSLHLSDVYAVAQGVRGVRAALVTRFRHHRAGEPDSSIPTIENHIFISNSEILRCNDPADPQTGTFELTMAERPIDAV